MVHRSTVLNSNLEAPYDGSEALNTVKIPLHTDSVALNVTSGALNVVVSGLPPTGAESAFPNLTLRTAIALGTASGTVFEALNTGLEAFTTDSGALVTYVSHSFTWASNSS